MSLSEKKYIIKKGLVFNQRQNQLILIISKTNFYEECGTLLRVIT